MLSAEESEEEDERDRLGDGGDLFFSDEPTVSALEASVEAACVALRFCLMRLSNPALGIEELEDDDSTALAAPSSLTC